MNTLETVRKQKRRLEQYERQIEVLKLTNQSLSQQLLKRRLDVTQSGIWRRLKYLVTGRLI